MKPLPSVVCAIQKSDEDRQGCQGSQVPSDGKSGQDGARDYARIRDGDGGREGRMMKVYLSVDERYSLDPLYDDSMISPTEIFKISRVFWWIYRIAEMFFMIFQNKLEAMEEARYRKSK